MSVYTLKRQNQVVMRKLVPGGTTPAWTLVDIDNDYSLSQTFTDKTYKARTLQENHKFHDASNIKFANPGDFEFTVPIIPDSTDFDFIYDLAFGTTDNNLDAFEAFFIPYDSFSPSEVKDGSIIKYIQKGIITNASVIVSRDNVLALKIRGQAQKIISMQTGADPYKSVINAAKAARSGVSTYQKPDYLRITVDGDDITKSLISVSIELQNKVQWTPYTTVQASRNVTDTDMGTAMYPSGYTLQNRILAGSFTKYTDSDIRTQLARLSLDGYAHNVPIVIQAGRESGKGINFTLSDCSYTLRTTTQDVYTASYDWKMNNNPVDLTSILLINS
jgi:hypothetical protein